MVAQLHALRAQQNKHFTQCRIFLEGPLTVTDHQVDITPCDASFSPHSVLAMKVQSAAVQESSTACRMRVNVMIEV